MRVNPVHHINTRLVANSLIIVDFSLNEKDLSAVRLSYDKNSRPSFSRRIFFRLIKSVLDFILKTAVHKRCDRKPFEATCACKCHFLIEYTFVCSFLEWHIIVRDSRRELKKKTLRSKDEILSEFRNDNSSSAKVRLFLM